MRHRKRTIKLGRTNAHRDALLAGLVCNLIHETKITTTLPKAKAASRMAEKMVTLGKKGTLAARRRAISKLRRSDRVGVLFDKIAPTFVERSGGYTRITKLGQRRSDGSEMALLEWVEGPVIRKKKKRKKASTESKAKKKAATNEDVSDTQEGTNAETEDVVETTAGDASPLNPGSPPE